LKLRHGPYFRASVCARCYRTVSSDVAVCPSCGHDAHVRSRSGTWPQIVVREVFTKHWWDFYGGKFLYLETPDGEQLADPDDVRVYLQPSL
jgi:DNA-directed RNA polymerase subunit RPC12/RpoP